MSDEVNGVKRPPEPTMPGVQKTGEEAPSGEKPEAKPGNTNRGGTVPPGDVDIQGDPLRCNDLAQDQPGSGPFPECVEGMDDPFTPANYTEMDKLIDVAVMASYDEHLGRGDVDRNCEPDEPPHDPPYEPPPTLDLVRREGQVQISWVEWKDSHPQLTTYGRSVSYKGRHYLVPSLPSVMCGKLERK